MSPGRDVAGIWLVRDVVADGRVVAANNPTLYAVAAGTVGFHVRPGDTVARAEARDDREPRAGEPARVGAGDAAIVERADHGFYVGGGPMKEVSSSAVVTVFDVQSGRAGGKLVVTLAQPLTEANAAGDRQLPRPVREHDRGALACATARCW